MDTILDRIIRVARRCERAARTFIAEPFATQHKKLLGAAQQVGEAWSGSWIGPHAHIYIQGLRPSQPGEHFDAEWGYTGGFTNRSVGPWCEYAYEAVEAEIAHRCGLDALPNYTELTNQAREVFDPAKAEMLPALDAILSQGNDEVVREQKNKLSELSSHLSASDYITVIRPTQFFTRDTFAMQKGIWVPHHLAV
jgi:hypothetical protein